MSSNHTDKPNIFLMPCGAAKTKQHLHQTVLRPVQQSIIFPLVSEKTKKELESLFGQQNIPIWGTPEGRNNRIYFNKMQPGDHIIFTVGQKVVTAGRIIHKTINPKLAKTLWPGERVFSLVYFLWPVKVADNMSLLKVFEMFGYRVNYTLQGLTCISSDRLKRFYDQHQDIFSVIR